MSLIKTLLEMDTTSSTNIANSRGFLFGGKQSKKKIRRRNRIMTSFLGYRMIGEAILQPDKKTPEVIDVLSKISNIEKKLNSKDDVAVFGLEDDNGDITKVYVKTDQAEEFEKTLGELLANVANNEEDDTQDNTQNDDNDSDTFSSEIAEILFKLKDKFDIIDVVWPTIEGDEEEEQDVVSDEEGDVGIDDNSSEDDTSNDADNSGDMEDLSADDSSEDESIKSTLQQIIDMMKADAEAKKAEAEAKKAEAEAREAELTKKAAEEKVKQEEEILDMEAYYKQKSDQDKEAKRLAKLAKYKHDLKQDQSDMSSDMSSGMSSDMSSDMSSEDEEEDSDTFNISLKQLSKLIMRNLAADD